MLERRRGYAVVTSVVKGGGRTAVRQTLPQPHLTCRSYCRAKRKTKYEYDPVCFGMRDDMHSVLPRGGARGTVAWKGLLSTTL